MPLTSLRGLFSKRAIIYPGIADIKKILQDKVARKYI